MQLTGLFSIKRGPCSCYRTLDSLIGLSVPHLLAQSRDATAICDTTRIAQPQIASDAKTFRQEKRAQRLSFWVRRPPGGVGVFHAKGWWPKTSCPREIRDVPGILPGCPGPLAVFKKFVQKNFVRIFRSLNSEIPPVLLGIP